MNSRKNIDHSFTTHAAAWLSRAFRAFQTHPFSTTVQATFWGLLLLGPVLELLFALAPVLFPVLTFGAIYSLVARGFTSRARTEIYNPADRILRRRPVSIPLHRELEPSAGIVIGELVLRTSDGRCPVCAELLGSAQPVRCRVCSAPHHQDCWSYNENCCGRYGCDTRMAA